MIRSGRNNPRRTHRRYQQAGNENGRKAQANPQAFELSPLFPFAQHLITPVAPVKKSVISLRILTVDIVALAARTGSKPCLTTLYPQTSTGETERKNLVPTPKVGPPESSTRFAIVFGSVLGGKVLAKGHNVDGVGGNEFDPGGPLPQLSRPRLIAIRSATSSTKPTCERSHLL